nr:IucA/IucC family C-terminal-domain containing protein [Bacillus sp. 165]
MSKYNKGIDIPLSQIFIDYKYTKLAVYIPSGISEVCWKGERNEWRNEIIRKLFAEHLTIIIEALSHETKLPRSTMWAHIAFYVHVMYKKWIEKEKNEVLKKQLQEDFYFLVHKAPAKWFGEIGCNPLKIQFCHFPHPVEKNESVVLRKVCCMNYKAGRTCYTCPRISNTERVKKIMDVYQKA